MISLEVAKSLESFETSSLVARDVTGGGGKATRTKTRWHRIFKRDARFVKMNRVPTGS